LAAWALALLIGLDFATTGLAAGFPRQQVADDMLLWNAEVQYVCRNAARQSHGSQIRGPNRPCWLFPAASYVAKVETI
jgi:hypothetical protein